MVLTGPVLGSQAYILALEIFSVGLGGWAIYVMRVSKLNIFPDVLKGAELIEQGPYSLIRHPMYLAVLLFVLTLLLESITILRAVIFFVLLADLLIKIKHEEKLMRLKFASYSAYCKRTKKLLPYIY
jgi:protein-S-isoprenylcysteine O-methyltransferase Ste14